MNKSFSAVLLCAGKGTRFKSDFIKVLHPFLGTSMLHIAVNNMFSLDPESLILVVGHQREQIMKEDFGRSVQFAVQEHQLGTADAVLAAKNHFLGKEDMNVLVMNSDLPLVRPETLRPFLDFHLSEENVMTFLVADLENPYGFGRLIHGADGIIRIIEEKDATSEQRKIRESNLGVYLFRAGPLFDMLPRISTDNAKGEYYLTDIIEIMMRAGLKTGYFKTGNSGEFIGVNDRHELALAADVLRRRKLRTLSLQGVTFLDPSTTWIDLDVQIGRDTVISPSVVIEGASFLGEGCLIRPFVRIKNTRIGDGAEIGSFVNLIGKTIPAKTKMEAEE